MTDAVKLVLGALDAKAQVEVASDLATGCAKAQATPALDLVLLDLTLPDSSGMDALARFRERFPELPVVVFSGSHDHASVVSALDLGAMGYIPKTAPREVLLSALRLVISGGIYVPVEALNAPASSSAGAPAPASPTTPAKLGLSPRQGDVLALLLKGLPNKLIARRLEISENTAKAHVSAVFHTLGVNSRTQAVIAASRLGVRLDPQSQGYS